LHKIIWGIDEWESNDSFATTYNIHFSILKLLFFPKVSSAVLALIVEKVSKSDIFYFMNIIALKYLFF